MQEEVPPGVEAPRKKPHPHEDLNATEQDHIFKASVSVKIQGDTRLGK